MKIKKSRIWTLLMSEELLAAFITVFKFGTEND